MAKFSSASDVWSFGVSIWEIYSLGDIPWKGLDPMAIKDLLVEGERLGCPVRCPADIYELVQTCWRENPQVRPTFAEIHQKLQLVSLTSFIYTKLARKGLYLIFRQISILHLCQEWNHGSTSWGHTNNWVYRVSTLPLYLEWNHGSTSCDYTNSWELPKLLT